MTDNLTPALQADNIVKVYDEGPARIRVPQRGALAEQVGEEVEVVGVDVARGMSLWTNPPSHGVIISPKPAATSSDISPCRCRGRNT